MEYTYHIIKTAGRAIFAQITPILIIAILCLNLSFNTAIAQGKIEQPKLTAEIQTAEVIGYVMTVTATAYTPFEPGMTSGTGLAYDGRPAVPYKTAAVDPKVIPLGSRVFVPDVGWLLAHDTGSAIKGNRIDVCLETDSEMINFGRKSMEIYVVPPDRPYRMAW